MGLDWYIPVLIFVARIADVSLGTVRMVMVIQGHKLISAAIGFFEIIIWAFAVGGVIKFLDNPVALVAYAGGFSAGTLVGMAIEERIALGYRVIQVINREPTRPVGPALRGKDFRVTTIDGSGRDGPVEIAYTVIRRRHLRSAMDVISASCPEAFVTVERADRPAGGSFTRVGSVGRWRRRSPTNPASIRK